MDKKDKDGEVVRKRPVWCLGVVLALVGAWILAGCAGTPVGQQGSGTQSADGSELAAAAPRSEPSKSGKRFEEPSEVDRLLDAKPIALAAVKLPTQGASAGTPQSKTSETASSGKGKFRIQISAESDMDAAQTKKGNYEKQLGGSVDVIFDPPYYKLRWGYFDSKQDAEDKLLELSDQKIQGFVVKQ